MFYAILWSQQRLNYCVISWLFGLHCSQNALRLSRWSSFVANSCSSSIRRRSACQTDMNPSTQLCRDDGNTCHQRCICSVPGKRHNKQTPSNKSQRLNVGYFERLAVSAGGHLDQFCSYSTKRNSPSSRGPLHQLHTFIYQVKSIVILENTVLWL